MGDGRTKARNHAIVVVRHLVHCRIQVGVGVALFTLVAELLVLAWQLREFSVIAGSPNLTPARLCRDIEACGQVRVTVILACHRPHRSKKVRIALARLDLETEDDEGDKDRDDGKGDEEDGRLHAPVLPHLQNLFLTFLFPTSTVSSCPQPSTLLSPGPHLSSHLPIEDTTAAASAGKVKSSGGRASKFSTRYGASVQLC